MTSIGEGVKEDRNEIEYPLKSSGKVNDPILFGAKCLRVEESGIVPVTK